MTDHHIDCCLQNDDVHTLTPGCPTCERIAEHPGHRLASREFRTVLAKFHDTGIRNDHPRTPLDAQLATAVERAYGIARLLGWITPGQPIGQPMNGHWHTPPTRQDTDHDHAR